MKKVLSYILIFILIILFTGAILLNVARYTILKPEYIIASLEENNYYEKIDINIEESFRNYILQSGLEEDALNDLYNFAQIKQDVNGIINSMYSGTEYKLNTDGIRNKLQNKIDTILAENRKKVKRNGKG